MNASHVRAVSVTLQLTEEAIDRIERLLVAAPPGSMHHLVDDLAPGERQRIHILCRHVREAVQGVANHVPAEIATRSLRGAIRGEVATLWATLQDTKSDALRGYGPLSSEDGVAVDDSLEAISRHVTAIFRLVETAHGDGVENAPARGPGQKCRR